MDNQHDDGGLAGDLLVGADAIKSYLIYLGWPKEVDPYYLKRHAIVPIGKTSGGNGGKLIASKRRLSRHAQKLATPAA